MGFLVELTFYSDVNQSLFLCWCNLVFSKGHPTKDKIKQSFLLVSTFVLISIINTALEPLIWFYFKEKSL